MMTDTLAPIGRTGPVPVAVIDVGSNGIRMVIAEIDGAGNVTYIENLQRAVPLGLDSFSEGKISTRTINLAIEVLRGYREIMEPYNVAHLRAVATSAVREAQNTDLFLERIFVATGISVEVISGSEQDRLIYAAVRQAFEREGMGAGGATLIIELGSGTAEISILREGEVVWSGSYAVGTIRLRNAVRPARRAVSETISLMKDFIGSTIDAIEHAHPLEGIKSFVMVGADARFAGDHARKRRIDGELVKTVPRSEFLRFSRQIMKMRPEQVAQEYALPFEDCETLGPALLAYSELLKRTAAREATVAYVSMRDGMILDFVAEQTGQGYEEFERQMLSSAESIGLRYQFDERHAWRVSDLACRLFDQLTGEHGLDRRARRLLRVAALMHDIGMFISNRSHHKHSEYIIRNSEIFGLRPDDKELVANIARYHRGNLPRPTHPAYMALSRKDRALVSKAAAILRVADAIDRGHSSRVRDAVVELRRDEMILHITPADEDLTLERLALEKKADFFEEVFGRKVVLEQ